MKSTIATLMALVIIISCKKKKDDDYVPADTQRPIVTFTVNGAASSNGQHNIGDTVNFVFTVTDNAGLASYLITKTINYSNSSTLQQANISGTSFQIPLSYIVDTTITTSTSIVIRCSATDTTGNSSQGVSDGIYLISINANSDITTIGGQQLFSFNSTGVSKFYSLSELNSYDSAYAFNNQGKIDLLFGTNTPDTAFLSPQDPFAQTFFNTSSWSTKNNTLFKETTMSSSVFNSIFSAYQLKQLYNSFTSSLAMGVGVNVGDIVAFQTASGKKGFILVTDLNNTGLPLDNIQFDIIMEK